MTNTLKTHRVSTYVDDEAYALIKTTSKALGMPISRVIGDMVESALPVLEVLLDAALTIKQAPGKQRAALAHLADQLLPLAHQAEANLHALENHANGEPPAGNTGVTK